VDEDVIGLVEAEQRRFGIVADLLEGAVDQPQARDEPAASLTMESNARDRAKVRGPGSRRSPVRFADAGYY